MLPFRNASSKKRQVLAAIFLTLLVFATIISPPFVAYAQTTGSQKVDIVPGAASLGEKALRPNSLQIRQGDKTVWVNNDNVLHRLSSQIGIGDINKRPEFDSGFLKPKDQYSHVFNKTGTFPYFCQLHPTMTGVIRVGAAEIEPSISSTKAIVGSQFGTTLVVVAANITSQNKIRDVGAFFSDSSQSSNATKESGSFALEPSLFENEESEEEELTEPSRIGSTEVWVGAFDSQRTRLSLDRKYSISLVATDDKGIKSKPSLLEIDPQRVPLLETPGNLTVTAPNYNGTTADFDVRASTFDGKPLESFCTPKSGSFFPPGVTTVWCGTVDENGNFNQEKFSVAVLTPPIQQEEIKIEKEVYSSGDTVFFKGRLDPKSNVTITLTDPLGQTHQAISGTPIEDGNLSLPIKLDNVTTAGNWTAEVQVNGKSESISFAVESPVNPLPSSIELPQGEFFVDNVGKSYTRVRLNNTGQEKIDSLLIKTEQQNIQKIIAKGWDVERISNSTYLLTATKGLEAEAAQNLYLKWDARPDLGEFKSVGFDILDHDQSPLVISTRPLPNGPVSQDPSECFVFSCPKLTINFEGDAPGKAIIDHSLVCTSPTPCSKTFHTIHGNVPGFEYFPYATITVVDEIGGWFVSWGDRCDDFLGQYEGDPHTLLIHMTEDITCNIRFERARALYIDNTGPGIGEVTSDPPGIKCGTNGTGVCAAAFDPLQPIRLIATPSSVSNFGEWFGGDCVHSYIRDDGKHVGAVQFEGKDRRCGVRFNVINNQVPSDLARMSPEFIDISWLLSHNLGINIGWPVSNDRYGTPISHVQSFKESANSKWNNSIQMYKDDDNRLCIAVSYNHLRSPFWYDNFWAHEDAYTMGTVGFRQWAGDSRNLAQIMDENKEAGRWADIYSSNLDSRGQALPPGRDLAPKTFHGCHSTVEGAIRNLHIVETRSPESLGGICKNQHVTPTYNRFFSLGSGLGRVGGAAAGAAIGGTVAGPLGALVGGLFGFFASGQDDHSIPPNWGTILLEEGAHDNGDGTYTDVGRWKSSRAEGVITNSWLAGVDAEPIHQDYPGGYKLSQQTFPTPIVSLRDTGYWPYSGEVEDDTFNQQIQMPYFPMNAFRNCDGPFTARYAMCNDWNMSMSLDHAYRNLVPKYGENIEGTTTIINPNKGNLVLENEQWLIPQGYRADVGDRALAIGRWISDCAEDWHGEIHPIELLMTSFIQTEPLYWDMNVPAFDKFGMTFFMQRPGTINHPAVVQKWSETGGVPATVNRIVVTGAWQGGDIEFDMWPPSRTSDTARLRWTQESNPVKVGPGIDVSFKAVPSYNPNHLHFKITLDPDANYTPYGVTKMGEVKYDANLRVVDSYLLWWDE